MNTKQEEKNTKNGQNKFSQLLLYNNNTYWTSPLVQFNATVRIKLKKLIISIFSKLSLGCV